MTKTLLTIQEVSELTGFSTVTLYKWARTNAIPSKKYGRSVRFNAREIERWMDGTPRAHTRAKP